MLGGKLFMLYAISLVACPIALARSCWLPLQQTEMNPCARFHALFFRMDPCPHCHALLLRLPFYSPPCTHIPRSDCTHFSSAEPIAQICTRADFEDAGSAEEEDALPGSRTSSHDALDDALEGLICATLVFHACTRAYSHELTHAGAPIYADAQLTHS